MSMRIMVYGGGVMILVGVAMFAAGILVSDVAGGGTVGLCVGGIGCATGGAFMISLGRGWDEPLESAAELYKYGRPANAEVMSVTDAKLDAAGTRTAKLTVHVSPVNESDYKSTRMVALPGGRVPAVGETVTVKFDPNSRKDFVLLEESFEVKDQINAAADAFFGGLQK